MTVKENINVKMKNQVYDVAGGAKGIEVVYSYLNYFMYEKPRNGKMGKICLDEDCNIVVPSCYVIIPGIQNTVFALVSNDYDCPRNIDGEELIIPRDTLVETTGVWFKLIDELTVFMKRDAMVMLRKGTRLRLPRTGAEMTLDKDCFAFINVDEKVRVIENQYYQQLNDTKTQCDKILEKNDTKNNCTITENEAVEI